MGHPLLLAAGEVLGRFVQQRPEIHGGGGPVHGGAHRLFGEPQVHGPEGNLAADRGPDELILGVLKHQAHRLAEPVKLPVPAAHRRAVQKHLAALGRQDPVAEQEQRGFARAVGAQQGHPLAGGQGKVHLGTGRSPPPG